MSQDQSVDTVYINFFAAVTPQSVQNVMNVCTQLINDWRPKRLYFAISSNGGEVNSGFTLYNYLVALPVEIVMHNIGAVESISTIIFLAGKERFASPHSTFLYHGIGFSVSGNFQFTIEQLNERVGSLAADEARIAEIISDKTNVSELQVKEFQKQGVTLNPSIAKDYGIIHDIADIRIPGGAPIINVVM